jgi:hypothetical protein
MTSGMKEVAAVGELEAAGTTHAVTWHRLDGPGRDACSLRQVAGGWCLDGIAEFAIDGELATVCYRVSADAEFRTRSASLSGSIGAHALTFDFTKGWASDDHEVCDEGWRLNGSPLPGLDGCRDLDLGFTPATNLLSIRRLALAIGDRANAPAAWFDVARGSLEVLPQVYERRGERQYWYEAPSVEYAALLEVDEQGFVLDYPGLWRAHGFVPTSEGDPPQA